MDVWICKNADKTPKLFVNWSSGKKVKTKTKNIPDFPVISFIFCANISTDLRGSKDAQICFKFFGSSPIVIELDKIVAEINNTTFVFETL